MRRFAATAFALLLALPAMVRMAHGAASVSQATRKLSLDDLRKADALIDQAIAAGQCPGAVLLVGAGDDVVYRRAYGNRSIEPRREPMTVDTIFDMASLTKAVATAPSIMILAQRGRLRIPDPVAKYLPEFGQNGKQAVTIEQLLLHRGGLPPDDDIADYANGPAEAWNRICAIKPESEPGTRFAYSDVGYIVLGKLVERVSGRTLDQFARDEIFEPLGMTHARFKPPQSWRDRIAPTEKRDGRWIVGEVHDPRSYALGGVAGHAGLFATADDLSRFCRMLLHEGRLAGVRVLEQSTVRDMTRPRRLPDGSGCRGLGFDIDTPYSGCRGDRFAAGGTYGHTGFTGTMFWIDPVHQCYLILLTNSVHPDGKGNILKLRHEVATVVAEALLGKEEGKPPQTHPAVAPVMCGIDVLEAEHFSPLAGKRVALVTNQSGLDAAGRRTIDLLKDAGNLRLVKLFSPEHGLAGVLDQKVGDGLDEKTGLKVISLYGDVRKPTPQMLADVDAIVYDIQDAGARYYTYVATMGYCMEAAAGRRIPFFLLDRPNPVTGLLVDGPLADDSDLGFIAYAPIPVAHGMTLGELARMFNIERRIGCDLTVIPMRGWRRWMWFDDTGRMWVNPSPNLRNPTQALLYLGVGLLEASNVSVGRGTDQPFELFGAPWIDGRKLAASLNEADLPGLRFVPVTFKPASSKFAGRECQGCYIEVIDRTAVEPVRAGLTIAWTLKHLFGDQYDIAAVGNLMRNRATLDGLKATDNPAALPDVWRQPLEEFARLRGRYLLYP